MLGVFAEFETNLRRERQLEGIQQAKAKGVYKGRKPSIDVARVKALRDAGKGPAAIAKELKMARSSVEAHHAAPASGSRYASGASGALSNCTDQPAKAPPVIDSRLYAHA